MHVTWHAYRETQENQAGVYPVLEGLNYGELNHDEDVLFVYYSTSESQAVVTKDPQVRAPVNQYPRN